MASDLCFTPATELARRIRSGDLSPVDVVSAHLDRIEERDPTINAFTVVLDEAAMDAAREAEAAVDAGAELGPLHGVPVAIKDFFGIKAGVRHTFGSRAFADFVPDRDELFVERLEAAGAIVIGKTNTPEFTRKGTTTNPLFGTTVNPWDTERTPSGSSGGSAAAVADGMVPLAQGSDVAGSIRGPASACGIYGIKPSPGRVPKHFRPNGFVGRTPYLDIGPLARSVADAALLLDVIAGPHPADPICAPDDGTDYVAAVDRSAADFSVAYSPDLGLFPIDDRVVSAVESAVDALAGVVDSVDRADAAIDHDLDDVLGEYFRMIGGLSAEVDECFAAAYGVDVLGEHRDLVTDYVVQRSEAAREMSAIEYTHTGAMRTTVFDAVQAILDDHDVLVTPTLAVPPFELGIPGPSAVDGIRVNEYLGWLLTWPFNMTGHPVASVPAGSTDEGLPVGLQVVGRRYADDDVIAASRALERANPWAGRYPPGW